MRELKIQDIIKILPLEEGEREALNKKYQEGDKDVQFSLQQSLWGIFNDYKQSLTELKLNELLAEVKEGKHELSKHMNQEASQKVWEGFDEVLSGKAADRQQIQAVREKLQGLLN